MYYTSKLYLEAPTKNNCDFQLSKTIDADDDIYNIISPLNLLGFVPWWYFIVLILYRVDSVPYW